MIDGNFGYNSFDDEIQNFIPKITVMGVGGAGCNAVNNMIEQGIDGVDFVVANTDAQSLMLSKAPRKIQLGKQTTKGFGAGSRPDVGQKAAEESSSEISDIIKNSNILFLTAGMGGGTGSGAMPVIASLAKEKGILTVAIITTPFDFEGKKKGKIADEALKKLIPNVDSYIVLPNQNLYSIVDKQMTFLNAFKVSDNVLCEGVKNITDLIRIPGTINLDFADIRAVMEGSGRTIIGTAIFGGEKRALKAVEGVLLNPLLRGNDIRGAKSVLVNITANPENLSLDEPAEVMNTIRAAIDSDDTNFYLGTCFDARMGEDLKVAIIATGLNKNDDESSFYRSSLSSYETEQKYQLSKDDKVKVSVPFSSVELEINEKIEDVEEKQPLPIDNETFEKDPEVGIAELGAEDFILENTSKEEDFVSSSNSVFSDEDNSFDAFLRNSDSSSIDDFINREAEKMKNSYNSDLDLKKDDNGNDDDDPTPPNGGNGKKKNTPLSSFFDMMNEDKEDSFFDNMDIFSDDDAKLSVDKELEISASKKTVKDEDDNVVFLAGSLNNQKQESKQIDLMEVMKKMEETLEIPAIFKNTNK